MGKTFDAIDERLEPYLRDQRLFFVATAPLDADGYLNCSPKGLCAFEVPPKIARLHGRGAVVEPADERFAALRARFPAHHDGVRSVIQIAVERISDSGWRHRARGVVRIRGKLLPESSGL